MIRRPPISTRTYSLFPYSTLCRATAATEGIPVQELAARNSDVFEAMDKALDISFDRFIRTTDADHQAACVAIWERSEEHTSELQSLMRTSYAVFCLKKYTTPHSLNILRSTITSHP